MYRDPSPAVTTDALPAFLRLATGSAGLAELRFAPDIPPKQLQGCLAFAQVAPGEQPVALLDTTVLQSGRAGALVTSLALYLDPPRQRIPLRAAAGASPSGAASRGPSAPSRPAGCGARG